MTAVHIMVMVTGSHHHVPAGTFVHDGRAWLFFNHFLCEGRTSRANATHDQDLQQRGEIHCLFWDACDITWFPILCIYFFIKIGLGSNMEFRLFANILWGRNFSAHKISWEANLLTRQGCHSSKVNRSKVRGSVLKGDSNGVLIGLWHMSALLISSQMYELML